MSPPSAGRLADAVSAYRRGDLEAVQHICAAVLVEDPQNAEALHLLGLVAYRQRRLAEAVRLIGQAVALCPSDPRLLNHLGEALRLDGQLTAAVDCFRRALALRPEFPEAMSNFGLACRAAGQLDDAERLYRAALQLQPSFADAANNLGLLLLQRGDVGQAAAWFRRAFELQPASVEIRYNLARACETAGDADAAIAHLEALVAVNADGRALTALGRLLRAKGRAAEGEVRLRQALAMAPDTPHALLSLADELQSAGLLIEAEEVFHRATAFPATAAQAWNNLGIVQRMLNRPAMAAASYRRASELNPNLAEPMANLGVVEHEQGRLTEAIEYYSRALQLNPGYAQAHNNLGNAWLNAGDVTRALEAYSQAIRLKPDYLSVYSNRLLALLYSEVYSAEEIANQHVAWGKRLAMPPPLVPLRTAPSDLRRRALRVGVLSADFCRHPVSTFFEAVLADREQTEVEYFAYADVLSPDEVTARLRPKFHRWTEITHLSDTLAAERIRADNVDVLIELGGHTARSRLLVCAHRPAPVQVSYLGYPATTGLSTMDYRLTDRQADPPGQTDSLHTEKLVYLERSAWCFQPPMTAEIELPPAATRARPIRFGCFNILAKISPRARRLWGQLLQALPDAELVLKTRHSNLEWVQAAVRQDFAAFRVESRVKFLPYRQSSADHFRDYREIDLALDPFPYHGTTTTCEALWMGVPVVTLAGRSHVSRVGVSLLAQVGLEDCVAATEEDYVAKAVGLANDGARREALRSDLRSRMQTSSLMDARSFAADFRRCLRRLVECQD